MSVNAFQLDKLKMNFENIIQLKIEVTKIKQIISEKLAQLKQVYNELVKSNTKKILLFCLDSFYFQYKTFAMELDTIDRFRTLINNRMYCDYYKLYQMMFSNIKENFPEMIIDDNELKSFPAYKDLEPFYEYRLEDIRDIHSNILLLIHKMFLHSASKSYNIEHYNEKHHIGFSISNFINTLDYENKLLLEQIHLYMNYVSFFHISQKKQIKRLFGKMEDFSKEVEQNININQTFSIQDITDEPQLQEMAMINGDDDIHHLLNDSENLINHSEKMINRLHNMIHQKDEIPLSLQETISIALVEKEENGALSSDT